MASQEEFICHAACAASLTKLAKEAGEASEDTTFSQYAAAVLNSLVYLLKDSLERLQDIHNIEASMADQVSWKALPPRSFPNPVGLLWHHVMLHRVMACALSQCCVLPVSCSAPIAAVVVLPHARQLVFLGPSYLSEQPVYMPLSTAVAVRFSNLQSSKRRCRQEIFG